MEQNIKRFAIFQKASYSVLYMRQPFYFMHVMRMKCTLKFFQTLPCVDKLF